MILPARPVPTFRDLIHYRLDQVSELATAAGEQSAQLRFPVTVTIETRIWLELQSQALNGSLASVAGMILDAVAQSSMKTLEGSATLASAQESST